MWRSLNDTAVGKLRGAVGRPTAVALGIAATLAVLTVGHEASAVPLTLQR